MAFCGAILGSSQDAKALTIGDSHEVGFLWPGNLNGIIAIPFLASGHHLTGWTLFGAAGVGVPDGGITVMLLGVALGVLALARRFLMH